MSSPFQKLNYQKNQQSSCTTYLCVLIYRAHQLFQWNTLLLKHLFMHITYNLLQKKTFENGRRLVWNILCYQFNEDQFTNTAYLFFLQYWLLTISTKLQLKKSSDLELFTAVIFYLHHILFTVVQQCKRPSVSNISTVLINIRSLASLWKVKSWAVLDVHSPICAHHTEKLGTYSAKKTHNI